MQYTVNFNGCQNNIQLKCFDLFLIFAKNKDFRYTLRVPTIYVLDQKKKGKNIYSCKPQFYYIKMGCKGVFMTQTC